MSRVLGTVHIVTDAFVNAYIIDRGDHFLLIDTGIDTTGKLIQNYLIGLGRTIDDVSLILITHHHGDQIGSLMELKERTEARVAAHEYESELIRSKAGVTVDAILKHGDFIEGLEVIHTPGHTPGHIVLLDKSSGSLFIGDLAHEEGGMLYEIPHHYSMDPEGNRMSIARLLDYDFENVMPSHGNPIIGSGKDKVEKLVKELGLRLT